MFWRRFIPSYQSSDEEREALEKAEHILSDARQEAAVVLRQATSEAEQIVQNAKLLTQSMEEEMQATIAAKAEEMSQVMQSHLSEAGKEYSASLSSAQASFQESISEQLTKFSGELSGELSNIRRTLASWIVQQQEQLKGELEDYQKRQESRYAAQLSEMLPSILGTVVSRSLTPDDHETLIQEALEEARGAGVWQAAGRSIE